MNIFVLHENPKIAAQMLCDKHVVKMILETTQMLSTIQAFYGMDYPYAPTHTNHPCTIWARQSYTNWEWLFSHGAWLCEEYTYRYGKEHKCEAILWNEIWFPEQITAFERTPFVQAMPEQYKHENAVIAYRQYYLGEKAPIAFWKTRPAPLWYTLKDPTLNE